jgi:hypothetical protein
MVTKFNVIKQKRILCGIVDNLDLCQSGWAREISINLTDFMINRFNLKEYDIYIGKEDEILQEAAKDEFYSHAVLVASGTSFKLSDRIFSAIDRICEKDFFIAGHVLDRNGHPYFKNACFELHHQFYIVNLKYFKDIDCPLVGQEEWQAYKQIAPIRSEEYLYGDHEVPVWIKPGNTEKMYDVKLHGWNILQKGWENNFDIIDLGQDIRDGKKYIYYEHDHVFSREVSFLYYNNFFCHNMFAPFNSDLLQKNIQFEGPVEQYVTVGIGLHWIKNLIKLGYTQGTRVIFTDINFNCLRFMKSLIEDWDGVDYVAFYLNFVSFQPNNSFFHPTNHTDSYKKEWQEFVSSFENWKETWNNIRSIKFDFVLIDYTSSYNFNWLEKGKKTFLNLSDLFNHVPFVTTQPLKYRITCENRLLNSIRDHDPNITILLTSRASDGFRQEGQSTQLLGLVKTFDLTDINILKRPPWHEKDWNVFCVITNKPKLLG